MTFGRSFRPMIPSGLTIAPVRLLAGGIWLFAAILPAAAQTAGPPPATAVAPEAAKGARQEELDKVQAEQKKAADLAARLKAEVDSIGEDRRKLNELLISSAGKIRDV